MSDGRILVTGANGFVGAALLAHLAHQGEPVRGSVRDPAPRGLARDLIETGNLDATTDWRAALEGVDVVVHTAARVHLMRDRAQDPLAAYRAVNTDATLNLARQAAAAGVQRLVFVSSVKVLGEATVTNAPFTALSPPAPPDPYGQSKAEAEAGLWRIAEQTGLEVVVVRPPLVYGPGVRANFLRLMAWVDRGIPLPLAGLDNRRSLVGIGNLTALLSHCCTHPGAVGQTLLVSDGEDLSTSDLLLRMGRALGRQPRLFRAPRRLYGLAAQLGAGNAVARLTQSLQVDISTTCSTLDWRPSLSVDACLAATADWYRLCRDAQRRRGSAQ